MRAAFSLIEVLISVSILLIVSGGVFTLCCSNNFGSILSGDQSTAMTDAQTALRGIATDLCSGSAFATPTNTGGVRVTYSSGPAVEYYQSGTSLMRLVASTGNPTTTVVTGLVSSTGLTLSYYDRSMSAIAGPMDSTKYSQAAGVDVTVTITLAHSSFGTVTRTTRVVLRNKVS